VRLLIVGSGGREHALAWKLHRSPSVSEILVAPGNAGTLALGENVPVKAENIEGLLELAKQRRVDLTVVGPELPLAMGLADEFGRHGLRVFGPTQAAARLETSKAFAKDFMTRHNIPSATYRTFSDYDSARSYVASLASAPVIKASGLAGGKGVIVCNSKQEAQQALRRIMVDGEFGPAGESVIVEERLEGQEVSLLAFSDGERIAPMLPAQDHKAAYDGDSGPNTGGMGAYAPAAVMSETLRQRAIDEILTPAVSGMKAEGVEYRGVLYGGLILTADGPQVLEFNCRFGDPEAQVLLPLLDADLAEIMMRCIEGRLDPSAVRWHQGACVCVVMASGGYPGAYTTGCPIQGIEQAEAEGCLVFHAGTHLEDGQLVTSGGRVLGVTAMAASLREAIEKAYAGVNHIRFENAHYRHDIGAKGLALQD